MSRKNHTAVFLLIGAAVVALVFFSFKLSLWSGPEAFIEDRLVSPKGVRSDIVIVTIDSDSINKIGQWPWPRKVFADFVSRVKPANPKAVAFDVVFSEKSRFGEADDFALLSAIETLHIPVIMPVEGNALEIGDEISAPKILAPLKIFTEIKNVHLGHVNLILDRDNVVRSFPPEIKSGADIYESFAVLSAEKAGYKIPELKRNASERIVYSGPSGAVRRIPFYQALSGNPEVFSGKLIFIGATSPDLHDEMPTPLSGGTAMAGVEIQANIASMMIEGRSIKNAGTAVQFLIIVLLSLIPALFFAYISSSMRALGMSAVLGILANIIFFYVFEKGTVVNIFHSNLALVFSSASLFSYKYAVLEKSRREMRNIFGKYVSPTVLESILANPEKVALGGEEKTITVLFSDIRGFTTLSEKTTPQELVSVLNRYFTLMTGEVLANGGVLDKYIGDAVMAFWGAPLLDESQADNAFKASLGMLEKLKIFNEELKKEKGIEIDIGIGLYTGPAVVGNIGSLQRFDYTAMGDTVNVASRLEGLNKEYKTHLIIGETTKEKITLSSNFKKIGETHVKGRAEPIMIYTIEE